MALAVRHRHRTKVALNLGTRGDRLTVAAASMLPAPKREPVPVPMPAGAGPRRPRYGSPISPQEIRTRESIPMAPSTRGPGTARNGGSALQITRRLERFVIVPGGGHRSTSVNGPPHARRSRRSTKLARGDARRPRWPAGRRTPNPSHGQGWDLVSDEPPRRNVRTPRDERSEWHRPANLGASRA